MTLLSSQTTNNIIYHKTFSFSLWTDAAHDRCDFKRLRPCDTTRAYTLSYNQISLHQTYGHLPLSWNSLQPSIIPAFGTEWNINSSDWIYLFALCIYFLCCLGMSVHWPPLEVLASQIGDIFLLLLLLLSWLLSPTVELLNDVSQLPTTIQQIDISYYGGGNTLINFSYFLINWQPVVTFKCELRFPFWGFFWHSFMTMMQL